MVLNKKKDGRMDRKKEGCDGSAPITIAPGIVILDLALYLPRVKTLVLGDLHIGYEDSLIESGVLIPRFQTQGIIDRITRILDSLPGPVSLAVINGDLKHEFGRISSQEWKGIGQVLDLLAQRCGKVVVVKGNHDVMLGPVADKRQVEVVPDVRFGGILIAHGDQIPALEGIKTVIIGHEHPAVILRQGARIERFKCFLKGTFKSRTLIAMPSFQLSTEGTDILREPLLSPFLEGDLSRFEVFIVEDKVYHFGTVAKLSKLS